MANERRLIDANALKACVKNRLLNGAIISWLFSIIDTCPTVEEAVIPVCCKDCEHYDGHICNFFSEWPDQYNTGHTVYMEPDDFCSYGERRCE